MQLIQAKKSLHKRWQPYGIVLLSLLSGVALFSATPVGFRLGLGGRSPYDYPYARTLKSDNQQTVESAISFYQGRVQQHPSDGLNRAALAGAYLKMARVTGAENWYLLAEQQAQQSLANLPFSNDSAIMVLAEIAQAKHEFAEAVRLAQQLSGIEPLAIVVTSKLAMGDLEAAAAAAETTVDSIPSLGSLSLRGLTRQAQGDLAGAQQDFERAIAAEEPAEHRSSAQVRVFLGRLYAEQGKLEQAEQLYFEALDIVPNYPLALLNLAELKTRLGHYRAAKRHYSRLNTPVALHGAARILTLQNRSSEAAWQTAETALRAQIDENALGHRRDLAHLLLERGRSEDVEEAIALMQTETKTRRDAETLDTLAWALLRADRPQAARSAIREALDQGVQNAGIFYRAADIATALNDSAQAKSYLSSAQALDSTFDQQARQKLGLVKLGLVTRP